MNRCIFAVDAPNLNACLKAISGNDSPQMCVVIWEDVLP